jgi:hypothetical protein
MEYVQENWIEISVIVVAVIAVIFNIVELRKETMNYANPNNKQLANMASVFFSVITAVIFSYMLYSGDDDFQIAGYVFGAVALLTNIFSLSYFLNLIQA